MNDTASNICQSPCLPGFFVVPERLMKPKNRHVDEFDDYAALNAELAAAAHGAGQIGGDDDDEDEDGDGEYPPVNDGRSIESSNIRDIGEEEWDTYALGDDFDDGLGLDLDDLEDDGDGDDDSLWGPPEASRGEAGGGGGADEDGVMGRGLHSYTFQVNLSRF